LNEFELLKRMIPTVFYGHVLKGPFVLILFLIAVRELFPIKLLPYFILIAIIEIIYLFPYYKALESEDTSIISALFSLGKIFVPILAFFMVKEVLTFQQYFGFIIIIVSSALLTLHRQKKRFSLNKAFIYMGIATSLLSAQAVIYKHIFNNMGWLEGYSWAFIFIGLATFSLLLFKKQRKAILSSFDSFKSKYYVFVGNVLLSLSAWLLLSYAMSLTDVTLVKGVGSSQPFFAIIYAIVLKKYFPHVFKENIDRKSILKKVLLFILLVIGIILIIY